MNQRFIKGIILLIIIKLGKEISLAEEDEVFSGVKLVEGNSSVCRELSFKQLDEFSLCSFVKLGDERSSNFSREMKSRIFTLRDADSFISLSVTYYSLEVSINGTVTSYQKNPKGDLWMKMCLYKEAHNSDVYLRVNYRGPRKLSIKMINDFKNLQKVFGGSMPEIELPTETDLDSKSRPHFISKDGNASLCFHNELHISYSSYEVSVAAVSISDHFKEDKDDDNCIRTLKKEQIIEFSEQNWVANNVIQLSLNLTELCFDTFVIPFINQSGSYSEHLQLCKLLNGRLLHLEEVEHFKEFFLSFKSEMELHENSSVHFWISGGAKVTGSLNLCPTYDVEDEWSFVNFCSVSMDYTFCLSPLYGNFKFYGPLEKYDRNYFIMKEKKYSFYLKGYLFCNVTQINNKWVMSNQNHKEKIELESAVPMGRQNWTSANDKIPKLLTITHCKEKEFACSNGSCLPWNVRCNGFVECSDKSDEINCNQLQKENGYLVELPPLPNERESIFKIYYIVTLVSIADITSTERSIKMEIRIDLTWNDPRIEFWNIAKNEVIDIENIWSPKLNWIGNYRPGFLLERDEKKSFSYCISDPHSFETNQTRQFSDKDPYMGTYIKGEDMKILYAFASTMDVPCSFDLHKYPFGKQSCTIAFTTQNNEYNPNTKFVYAGNITDASNLFYNGSKQLGEYNFDSADHRVDEYGAVVVTIHLVNLYGFHMLNSFVPSVLICVITYSTLFFPIKDFSDRVMLSLTALLVLAALFTQSSNSSVITPYFKLLDIWYVVLIFYCFMIVIYNIWLRKFTSIEERKAKDTLLNAHEENLDEDCDFKKSETPNQWKKKLVFYNFVAIIFFSAFYILFLFFFCLAAAEVI